MIWWIRYALWTTFETSNIFSYSHWNSELSIHYIENLKNAFFRSLRRTRTDSQAFQFCLRLPIKFHWASVGIRIPVLVRKTSLWSQTFFSFEATLQKIGNKSNFRIYDEKHQYLCTVNKWRRLYFVSQWAFSGGWIPKISGP